jgi:transposase-like protein
MPDQNSFGEYEEAKTQAEGRRQQAISETYRAFNVKHAETMRKHRDAYMAARANWDSTKSTPEADGYEEARQAFLDANTPPDHTEARTEMDRALRAADEAFQADVQRIANEHGVRVG